MRRQHASDKEVLKKTNERANWKKGRNGQFK
jgi:hypothetical protein